jgi:hypothetical protein
MAKRNTKNIKRNKKGQFVGRHQYSFPKGKSGNPKGGYWNSEDSIGFQYKHLIKMTVDEFKRWMKNNPEKERTIAQELAYRSVIQARNDLSYLKEVTDRTEGRASQSIDMTSGGKPIPILDYTKKNKK